MATAPRIVPKLQAGGGEPSAHAAVQPTLTISPTILPYLVSIADGHRPLNSTQLSQFRSYCTDDRNISPVMKDGRLELHAFLTFMASSASNVLRPPQGYDLSYPISNYFISSSHNTYLTGNQLYGESSTDAYKSVLLRGCRCIEIDVWDGEPKTSTSEGEEETHRFRQYLPSSFSSHLPKHRKSDESPGPVTISQDESLSLPTPWRSMSTASQNEPRVLHGYTMTKEVSFRDVCIAIRQSAFVTSDLPIIVSLEIHTSAEQQQIMVDIIEETWKGMLVDEPDDGCKELPSPRDMRGKILVKVKHAQPQSVRESSDLTVQRARSSSSTSTSESEDLDPQRGGKSKKKSKIIETLSALGVYTRSYHFKDLTQPEATIPMHIFSLSEKKLMEVHESHGPTLFSHNRNFMMRAFPSGMRVSSSNLDPALFWRKGVQMVALNWQKLDEGMMLNEGMFAGESGWVLKPKGYRGNWYQNKTLSNESQADAIIHRTLNLSIEVLAGQHLPLPTGDDRPKGFRPYLKVELHVERPEERSGAPIEGGGKSKDGEYKRRTKTSKGVEPDFGGEKLDFTRISGVVEELSFVRFKIHDDEIGKDDLAAWACIRLDRLQEGYRFVHFMDAQGVESQGVLLVRVEKSLF